MLADTAVIVSQDELVMHFGIWSQQPDGIPEPVGQILLDSLLHVYARVEAGEEQLHPYLGGIIEKLGSAFSEAVSRETAVDWAQISAHGSTGNLGQLGTIRVEPRTNASPAELPGQSTHSTQATDVPTNDVPTRTKKGSKRSAWTLGLGRKCITCYRKNTDCLPLMPVGGRESCDPCRNLGFTCSYLKGHGRRQGKDDAGARRGQVSSQSTGQSPSSSGISQEFVHTSAASIAEPSEKPPPKCLQCRPRSRFVESCSVSDGNKSCDFCISRNYKCSYEFPPRSGNALNLKTPNKRPAPEDDHSSDDEPLSTRVSGKQKQARYQGPADIARIRLQEDDLPSTPITFSVSLASPREAETTQPSTGTTSSPPIPPSNPQARVIIPASNYGQPSAPPPLPPPQHTTSKVRCYNCRFRGLECLALLAVQPDGNTAEGDSCVFCRVNGYSCSIVRDRQSQVQAEHEQHPDAEEQEEQRRVERQRLEEDADRRTDRRAEDEDESPRPDPGLPTSLPLAQDAASSLPTPVSPAPRPVTPTMEPTRNSPPAATPSVTTSSPSVEPPEPRTPVRIIIPRRASAASRSTTITVFSPTPSDATLIASVSRDVSPLKLTALSPSRSKVDLLKKQWEIERLTEEVEDLRKEIRVEKEYTELKVKKLVKAGKRSEAKAMEVDQETTQATLKKALANQEKLLDIERCSLQILEMKFFDGGRPE